MVSLNDITPREWAIIVGLGAVALLFVWLWLRRWWRDFLASRATQRRFKRGAEGELLAEQILRDAGFTIVERQVQGTWELVVDGRFACTQTF